MEKGQIRDEFGECVCAPQYAKNEKGDCVLCNDGERVIDDKGNCIARK